MNALVAHRGPDDEGFMIDSGSGAVGFSGVATAVSVRHGSLHQFGVMPVLASSSIVEFSGMALGHRRLAIVDLSAAGHQPMCYRGHLWITYNGEIYNFAEIRAELSSLGHDFASQTDTEVILAAYEQWGSACLHRFNGMWAFAIYDSRNRQLFLARDRFGVKPLYYWISPSGILAFASEIKQFTVLPGWSAQLNGQRAYDFLVWGLTDHTSETMFSGVNQLPGGSCASVDVDRWMQGPHSLRSVAVTRWYEPSATFFSGTFEEAAESVLELLTDSVALRMRSDVPFGSCLSGGLDSSTIVCLMDSIRRQRGLQTGQMTFSARSESSAVDEGKWIDQVILTTGLESRSATPCVKQVFEERRDVVWFQDEPYGSTSIHAQWSVFHLAASERIKVMLDGQGADELFAGYFSYFGVYLAELLGRGALCEFAAEVLAITRRHRIGLRSLAISTAHHTFSSRTMRAVAAALGRTPFEPAWLDMQRLDAKPIDPFSATGGRGSAVHALSLSQLCRTNLPMLLHWEDRSSMAHSIEARVPFLDYRLIEFVLGLPSSYKLDRAVTKRVLREAARGVLPGGIRTRMDKIGFATAEEVWLRKSATQAFAAGIEHAIDASDGVITHHARAMVQDIIHGRMGFSFLPWRIISFDDWLDRFSVRV